jgi:hypothetical protein
VFRIQGIPQEHMLPLNVLECRGFCSRSPARSLLMQRAMAAIRR